MASILLAACPFTGHVRPTVQLAAGPVAAGHEVRVITGSRFAELVRSSGAAFAPLPVAADLDETRLTETFPERAGLSGVAAARFDMDRIFLEPMPAQLATVDAALATQPADVIVAEPLFMAAWPLTQRPAAPPIIALGTMPPLSRQDAMPPVGPPLTWLGPLDAPTHRLLHRIGQRALFGPVQQEGRRRLLDAGEPAPDTFFLDWPRSAAGLIQLSVPAFEPIAGWPVPVHHVGSLSDGGSGASGASDPIGSEGWRSRVEAAEAKGVPVVHVTQGTAITSDYEHLLLPTLRALADRPVLVVATTGGRDPASVPGEVPQNAVVCAWVDYAQLLPHMDVMVTNGGYGGVHEALRHGIPLVLAGAQQDKAAIGTRVRLSGAGLAVAEMSPGERTIDRMVGQVLHDESYRRAARRLADDMAAAPGLAGAVAAVESVLPSRPPRT